MTPADYADEGSYSSEDGNMLDRSNPPAVHIVNTRQRDIELHAFD